jgi:hypothetical protein
MLSVTQGQPTRYSIENFLWSDEIIESLFTSSGCTATDEQRVLDLKKHLVSRPAGGQEDPLEPVKDIEGQSALVP